MTYELLFGDGISLRGREHVHGLA